MTTPITTPWISLSARYDIPASERPSDLLEDADHLLESAHGIAHVLRDALTQTDDFNNGDLANALGGMALLIELGQRCAQEAQIRTRPAPTKREIA